MKNYKNFLQLDSQEEKNHYQLFYSSWPYKIKTVLSDWWMKLIKEWMNRMN
ncbi:hypothetical protein NUSPORA_01661 [Nucleospora cyclopteri]